MEFFKIVSEWGSFQAVYLLIMECGLQAHVLAHCKQYDPYWKPSQGFRKLYKPRVDNLICCMNSRIIIVRYSNRILDALRMTSQSKDESDDESYKKATISYLLRIISALIRFLQLLIDYRRSFCKVLEYTGRRRPPCTTMPWNIWPALVVLWGVCWMFYNPTLGLYDESDWNDFPSISPYMNELPGVSFPAEPDQSMQNLYSAWNGTTSSADMLWPGNIPTSLSETELVDPMMQMPDSGNPSRADPGPPGLEQPVQANVATSAGLVSVHANPGQEPDFKCDFHQCRRRTFQQYSDLLEHIDDHHRCTVPDCTRTALFPAKGDLVRHRRSIHRIDLEALHHCDRPDCKWSRGRKGFSRRDHLLQHQRSHRNDLLKVGESATISEITSTDLSEGHDRVEAEDVPSTFSLHSPVRDTATRQSAFNRNIADSSAHLQATQLVAQLPSRKRQRSSPTHDENNEESNIDNTLTSKRPRSELEALIDENEKLKAEVERLKAVVRTFVS